MRALGKVTQSRIKSNNCLNELREGCSESRCCSTFVEGWMALEHIQCWKQSVLGTWMNSVALIPSIKSLKGWNFSNQVLVGTKWLRKIDQLECGPGAKRIPIEKLNIDDLTTMEEDSAELSKIWEDSEYREEPKVWFSRGQLWKKKIGKALTRKEKVLLRKVRHQL